MKASPPARRPDADPGSPVVEVLLVPPGSPLAPRVEAAARSVGLPLARVEDVAPGSLAGRVLVCDLTGPVRVPRLPAREAIAISPLTDLDAFDVIEPDRIEERLPRALRNAAALRRLEIAHARDQRVLAALTDLGRTLAEIDDRRALLRAAVGHAREVLHAEVGLGWLLEEDELRLVAAEVAGGRRPPEDAGLDLDGDSPEAFAVATEQVLNLLDVRDLTEGAPYRWNPLHPAAAAVQPVRSLLVAPLGEGTGRALGVLTLANRRGPPGGRAGWWHGPQPFEAGDVELLRSIAAQVGMALHNLRLYEEIRHLFDGFVRAAVTVIEARDPSTAGHSERVARLTLELARACDTATEPPFADVRFNPRELEELHYAALLHDFGKVGVPENILLKQEKLYPWDMERVEFRFQLAALQAKLESTSREMARSRLGHDLRRMETDLALIRRLNRPDHVPQPAELEALRRIVERWRLVEEDEPVLSERDVVRLCVPLGSLDPEERKAVELHVTHTWNFLRLIPWTERLARVPELAYAHHEKLDGSGYPNGLTREQIPFGARLMTVADIFDALTAGDRPYKAAMSPRKALYILRQEAAAGKIEPDVVDLLEARRLWRVLRSDGPAAG